LSLCFYRRLRSLSGRAPRPDHGEHRAKGKEARPDGRIHAGRAARCWQSVSAPGLCCRQLRDNSRGGGQSPDRTLEAWARRVTMR
jgi:hypothetical protein